VQEVSPKEYVRVKNRIADGLIDSFEKATGTSVREHIEELEVASPQTFADTPEPTTGGVWL